MEVELCLVCSAKPATNQIRLNSSLERELTTVFLLRELLKIPQDLIANCFQSSNGENPSSWFRFCTDCHAIVQEAEIIFRELTFAQRKLSECQRQIVEKIKSSSVVSRNCGRIGDTICQFVQQYQYSWPSDDPSAGDRMAKQLLDFKLQTANQKPTEVPQLKEEMSPVISKNAYNPITNSEKEVEDDIDIGEETAIQVKVEKLGLPKKTAKTKVQFLLKCQLCQFTGSKADLQKHAARNHNSDPTVIYQCENCPKWYNSQQQLSSHRHDAHGVRKTVKCSHCDLTSQRSQSIKRHIIRVHEKTRNFSCDLCDEKFLLLEDLRYHQAVVHHKCSVKDCFLICESQLHLREHQVNCHGKEVNVFRCPECGKLLPAPGDLRRHLKKVHGKWAAPQRDYKRKVVKKIPETRKCDKCNLSFSNEKQLKRHNYNVHVRGSKVLNCDQCDFVARRSDLFRRRGESSWQRDKLACFPGIHFGNLMVKVVGNVSLYTLKNLQNNYLSHLILVIMSSMLIV